MSVHCEACGLKTYKRFSCGHCGYVWSPEGEVEELRARLAEIDRQVLWRTEDMPEWAGLWVKDEMRRCYWWGVFCHTFCAAPDYRPDEHGPLFLPILDSPEGT